MVLPDGTPQARADAGAAPRDVTVLLAEIHAGKRGAWDELLVRVGEELRVLAHQQMARERQGHLLQTTALVNEVFIRLVKDQDERFASQTHFFAVAATAMRRILVDEARQRKAQKRGGGAMPLRVSQLAEDSLAPADDADAFEDVELVNRALESFEADARHEQKKRIVELRFFVGLSIEETARVLDISPATVKRDWDFARAWLRREIQRMGHA